MKRMVRVGLMGIAAAAALAFVAPAHATSGYNSNFRTAYPAAVGTRIDSCTICHTSVPALNSYGTAYMNASRSFTAIESADSDGDTYNNGVEIAALFFPGNAADHPSPPADTMAPTVSVFSIPSTSTSLTVPITTLTATDNVGVAGYLVNQSATKPAAGSAGWTTAKPTSYTFAAAGLQNLYAYAKDAAGNVSNGLVASVTITLAPPTDTTAPTVSVFSIPSTSTSLTVQITGITATDNVGVTGFLVSQSATKPAPGAAGWSVSVPASYTFAAAGAQTLYAYAKDAAGNVSNGLAASVTITLAPPTDTTAPTVSVFNIPSTSTSLTVPITTLTATDNVAVTGYLVNQSATKPASGAAGWTAAKPTSYTFAAAGAQTLYAYVKDAAGNVSEGSSASVTITLDPGTGPLFSDNFADATTKGDPNWETSAGRFVGRQRAYTTLGRADNLALVRDVIDLDPFLGGRIETNLRLADPSRNTRAGIVFDYQDARHYRYVLFNSERQTMTIGEVNANGDNEAAGDGARKRTKSVKVRKTPKGWHHLRVDVDSASGLVKVYLDKADRQAVAMSFASVGQGRVGILAFEAREKATFDNFTVQDASVLP